jgi:hypothetical protein
VASPLLTRRRAMVVVVVVVGGGGGVVVVVGGCVRVEGRQGATVPGQVLEAAVLQVAVHERTEEGGEHRALRNPLARSKKAQVSQRERLLPLLECK